MLIKFICTFAEANKSGFVTRAQPQKIVMGIFTLPPKPPRADLDIESYLKSGAIETPVRRFRRTLAAEWFPQSGVMLTWPHEATDWATMLEEVTETYIRMAYEIATREKLIIVHPRPEEVSSLLAHRLPLRATDNIIYIGLPTNDTWARDHAFLSVIGSGKVELMDFCFNAWGGKFEAELDNAINRGLFESGVLEGEYVPHLDFELEGGSVESDGMGTLLTTKACLLNENRLRGEHSDVGQALSEWLGVSNILWLEHGHIAGDDTDCHIDTLARLCPANTIAYVSCDDEKDEHYEDLKQMEKELESFKGAEGRDFQLAPLPLPAPIVEDGERLPATYANFLIMNRAILMPTYAQADNDERACSIVQKIFPKYDVVPIDCRSLIKQHGSLHCATMQFPRGVIKSYQKV